MENQYPDTPRKKSKGEKFLIWSCMFLTLLVFGWLTSDDKTVEQVKSNKSQVVNDSVVLQQAPKKVDSLLFYFNKGDSVFKAKNYQGAIKFFTKSVGFADSTRKQDKINLLISIANSYSGANNKYQAIVYYKKAYELEGKGGAACELLRDITAQKVITGYDTYSVCCNGSTSRATGRGACSHNGGVCGTRSEPITRLRYTMECE